MASFNIVPHWHEYAIQQTGRENVWCFFSYYNFARADIGVAGEHQKLNTSLALQLCRRWLIEKDQWKNFSGADTSPRSSQGMSKFSDGLPTPFKDGMVFLLTY